MLINNGREHPKFIFVHVQKTGGASISEVLKAAVPDIGRIGPRHISASEAMGKVEGWEEYFKFAFVRNPWARLVSWYSMINDEAKGQVTKSQKRRRRRNPIWRYTVENGPTFEDFIKNCTDEIEIKDGVCYSFAYNQLDYLTDENGDLLVDFIGRFERFDDDLAVAFDRIGVDAGGIPHKNRSLSSRSRRHYSSFYTPETEQIVRERFQKDIEYFGYEFEDANATADTGSG